ncbi:MAG: hypothetical protein MJZ32_08815 [Bacteroidaceae bacterium]|nr:hypothetical protein [Bacteroidaceae bacterium]
MAEIFYESQFGSYLYGIIFAVVFAFATGCVVQKLRKDHRNLEGWQKAVLGGFGVLFAFITIYSLVSMTDSVEGSVSITEKEIVIHKSDGDELVIPKEHVITWGMKPHVRSDEADKEIWEPNVVGYDNLRITYYESAAAAASYDNHGVEEYYNLMLYSGEDQLRMHDLMEMYYPRTKD